MAKQKYPEKKTVLEIPSMDGRIPPQALDLEEAVLGAIMLEQEAVIVVLDILKPEYFYNPANRKIFQAVCDLNAKESPVDLFTVTNQLRSSGELESIGGQLYLSQLTSKVVSAANVEYHAKIVAQKYIQRELIRVSSQILKKTYDDDMDVNDLLNFSENELFAISEGTIKKEVSPINLVIKDALAEIDLASKREDNLVGIPSGFSELDKLTYGWKKSELIIIAARPSMGKTAFALSMARNMAIDHKKKVAIFSCEMSSISLANRLMVAETNIPMGKLISGRMNEEEWKQLDAGIKDLVQAPIYLDETPAISTFELRAKCRRLAAQKKLDIVIIDYLQLMTGPEAAGSREQEVSMISRTLKSIAKELNVPVIALSQLNRSIDARGGTRTPILSDLRESGAIEQDADMVMFIHRQEKMGIPEYADGTSTKGMAELILAKNRNGPTDTVRVRFINEKAMFKDLDFTDMDSYDGNVTTFQSKMNDDSMERNILFGSNLGPSEDFDNTPF